MNIIAKLKIDILNEIALIFNLKTDELKNVVINLNTEKKNDFGDMSCNAVFMLTKILKKSPREIANQIKDSLEKVFPDKIEKVEIAGPGFLNIFLKGEVWLEIIDELFSEKGGFYKAPFILRNLSSELVEKSKVYRRTGFLGKKYLIEFVSANPTGPLHLGHGRNAIIGDVLGNVLKFLGYETVKEFYINDTGSQIHKLGQSLKIRCQQELGEKIEFPEGGYAGQYMIALAKKCVKAFGQDVLLKPDEFFADYAKDNLLENIKKDLNDYGINFDNWFSEKSLHESGAITKVLDQLIEKDLAYEKDGALWFRSSNFGDDKDRVIRKKDGALTYIAADIAYHKNKFDRGFDVLVDILGQDHHGYVKRLKATMSALDYDADNLDVILYQLVTLKKSQEALRMSKRAGKFVTLRDVIDTVGVDIARFFYLNRKADAHLEFDLDIALKKTEENPVYYIQYAYVRTGSLLQKAKDVEGLRGFIPRYATQGVALGTSGNIDSPFTMSDLRSKSYRRIGDAEIDVIKKIVFLQDVLNGIASGYHTHLLAYYSTELAYKFHNYYANNRIIDTENIEQTKTRLLITMLVRNCFELCLDLLGLSKPEKM